MRNFLYVSDLLFFTALLLAPAVWIADPLEIAHFSLPWHPTLLLPLLLFAFLRRPFRTWVVKRRTKAINALWETKLFKKISLAITSPFLLLLTFEYILLWSDFQSPLSPIVIQGRDGGKDPLTWSMVLDSELLWKLNPGTHYHGIRINSMGFLDREVDPVKKPGSIRVICMGDSCTGSRNIAYSRYLHALLKKKPPTPHAWECFNMGVPGYSAVQGLRLFQTRTKELQPDVVTVYFGWNDHWLSKTYPDSMLMAKRMNSFWGNLVEPIRKKKIYQLVNYLATPEPNQEETGNNGVCKKVPYEEYRTTLIRFAEEIRSIDAVPVFITAPRGKLTKALVRHGQATSIKEAAELHDRYVKITREVAQDTGSDLIDLFEMLDNEKSSKLIIEDGIHLSKEGLKQVAEIIYNKLGEIVAQEDWQK